MYQYITRCRVLWQTPPLIPCFAKNSYSNSTHFRVPGQIFQDCNQPGTGSPKRSPHVQTLLGINFFPRARRFLVPPQVQNLLARACRQVLVPAHVQNLLATVFPRAGTSLVLRHVHTLPVRANQTNCWYCTRLVRVTTCNYAYKTLYSTSSTSSQPLLTVFCTAGTKNSTVLYIQNSPK